MLRQRSAADSGRCSGPASLVGDAAPLASSGDSARTGEAPTTRPPPLCGSTDLLPLSSSPTCGAAKSLVLAESRSAPASDSVGVRPGVVSPSRAKPLSAPASLPPCGSCAPPPACAGGPHDESSSSTAVSGAAGVRPERSCCVNAVACALVCWITPVATVRALAMKPCN